MEKNSFKVCLDNEGNTNAWFYVMPHYKLRTVGDNVLSGDEVLFKPALSNDRTLTLSNHHLVDKPGCREVVVSNLNLNWKVMYRGTSFYILLLQSYMCS